MSAVEAAEAIVENKEGGGPSWSTKVALYIAALAAVLAINALGGNNAGKAMVGASIEASDSWAFYQAKTVRQTVYLLAADELELQLATQPKLPEPVKASFNERIAKYRSTVQRYESEADGTGKKELMAKAQAFEAQRDLAQKQDPYFDYAEALLQIAIVLASAGIAANRKSLVTGSYAVGALGAFLTLDAFTLWIPLPFLS